MTKINVTDSITTSRVDDIEDDGVNDVDSDVDVSGDVANDMAANMAMMWIEGMMCAEQYVLFFCFLFSYFLTLQVNMWPVVKHGWL
jgi:hypothetical protein